MHTMYNKTAPNSNSKDTKLKNIYLFNYGKKNMYLECHYYTFRASHVRTKTIFKAASI